MKKKIECRLLQILLGALRLILLKIEADISFTTVSYRSRRFKQLFRNWFSLINLDNTDTDRVVLEV